MGPNPHSTDPLDAALAYARRLRFELGMTEDDDSARRNALAMEAAACLAILRGEEREHDIELTGPGGEVFYLSDLRPVPDELVRILEYVVDMCEAKAQVAAMTPAQRGELDRLGMAYFERSHWKRWERPAARPTPTRRRGTTRERRPGRRSVRSAAASRDGPPRSDDDDPYDEVVEVAVAGDGPAALLEALRRLGPRSGLVHITVEHDRGCPATAGRSMRSCSCEIVRLRVRPLDEGQAA